MEENKFMIILDIFQRSFSIYYPKQSSFNNIIVNGNCLFIQLALKESFQLVLPHSYSNFLFDFEGINVAGVKWVIRLQLLLLLVLFLSALDFLVGSFVHVDWGKIDRFL